MIDKREEVCSVCYKFLNTIYDRKKMKNIKVISQEKIQETRVTNVRAFIIRN